MGRRSYWLAAALLAACSAGTPATRVCEPQPTERALVRPGASTGLTPDGRALMPHGELLELGQGPLHLAAAPGGTRIASAEFGVNLRGVSIVEAQAKKPLALAQRLGQWRYETDRGRRQGAYLRGLAFSADGRVLYAANTGTDAIDVFALGAADSFALQRSMPGVRHAVGTH